MPHLDFMQWLLAIVGAACVGIGKSGISGMGLLPVVIFAFIFGARTSTGIVLPMLLVGDVTAVRAFHRHARWDYIRRMLPPACIGVMVSAWYMRSLSEAVYKPIIGGIILGLIALQIARMQKPGWFGHVPHTTAVRLDRRAHRRRRDHARQRRRTRVRGLLSRRVAAQDGVRRHAAPGFS